MAGTSSLDYYRSARLDDSLSYMTDLRWRHFRFVLRNGKFVKINEQVKSASQLRKLILGLKPIDIYYSTSCFLDPTSISPRAAKGDRSTIFLYNDIVFDIDFSPVSLLNLERARKEALKIIGLMDGCELKYIAFSGSKGFHIVYKDSFHSGENDPAKREAETIKRRKALVEEMVSKGARFDSAITVDTRRILRLPSSINSKTGLACTIISRDGLERGIRHILSIVPNPGGFRVPLLNIPGYLPKLDLQWTRKRKRVAYAECYSTYLSSSVIGAKDMHAVFVEVSGLGEAKAVARLKAVMLREELPHMMVFRTGEGYCGVSLACARTKQLATILRRSQASNLKQLLKYRQAFLQLDLTPIDRKPDTKLKEPIAVHFNERCDRTWMISNGHLEFMGNLCKIGIDGKKIGKGDVKLVYAIEKAKA